MQVVFCIVHSRNNFSSGHPGMEDYSNSNLVEGVEVKQLEWTPHATI